MKLKITLFFCLCLVVKGSGGFAWYSPAMGVAFLINIGLIVTTFTMRDAKITKYFLGIWFLIFFIVAPFIWICFLVLLGTWIKNKLPRVFARLTGGR